MYVAKKNSQETEYSHECLEEILSSRHLWNTESKFIVCRKLDVQLFRERGGPIGCQNHGFQRVGFLNWDAIASKRNRSTCSISTSFSFFSSRWRTFTESF
uniref:Uncharacterized protein n=1 Tax=Opuntia streptacantha TaxID=393608 RepID=A0A7C9AEJ7_OPUST